MSCFLCNKNLYSIIDLGDHPPSDAFLKKEELLDIEKKYPLELCWCHKCCLLQLNYVVDPKDLFCDYAYNTSTNNSLKKNFCELAKKLTQRFHIKENDLVVDIGSNDGTLLSYFVPYKARILGIDPSSATKLAIQKNIPTIVDFFSQDIAKRVVNEHGFARIIIATNVFAHVDKLNDFVLGVYDLLAEDGVFVTESGYALDLITKLQYDSIYHEHLRYYSVKSLKILFEMFNLDIIDIERIPTHGGSIRVYAAKKGKYKISDSVDECIQREKEAGLYEIDIYRDFSNKVKKNKLELKKIVAEIVAQNKHIIGIGAPAKGNTLINYCEFGTDSIDYLAEKSKLKIGLYAPGSHIPIVDEERLFREQPDYALMLSWNLADELIPKLRDNGYKGKFIIPSPVIKII